MNDVNPLEFALNDEQREEVIEIVGKEYIDCVEDAIPVYFIKKRFYDDRLPIPQLNKTLAEIRDLVSAINKLLGDARLRDYLLNIAVENYGPQGRKQLTGKRVRFVNRTPGLLLFEALEDLDLLCLDAIKKQKPGKGRPKGSKDEAVNWFVNELYRCCESANGGRPLTNKPGNMLQRLVDVLYEPLDLGGNLPGLIKKVITSHLDKGKNDKR